MSDLIAPNVYRIAAGYVNLYLIAEEDGLTLVDTGMPRSEKLVWETIEEIGRQRSELIRIVMTHSDLDHAGSLGVIQAETGAKVYAGKETAVFLQSGKSPKHLPWFVQTISSLLVRYRSVSADVIEIVNEGDVLLILDGLQVLATPGHTMDHHSFFSPQRGVLFTGDALNTNTGSLQSSPERITADLAAAKSSALRLLELEPTVIACGHGDPIQNASREDTMDLFNQLKQS
ncbi:MAG: MBL fold metallo-hydrolase [Ardenticatenaceae bacterium]|nr:MBL fold metallo-hydrolase [Ardenticatenaceae bacterium]MCB9446151.1 MBL fold metallo-hydrolase [Ardenticatenaceae bacterium]